MAVRRLRPTITQLDRLRELVRIGWPLTEAPPFDSADSTDLLANKISKAIGTLTPRIADAPLQYRLQLMTLAVEFEYAFGKSGTAAEELATAVNAPGGLITGISQWQAEGRKRGFKALDDSPSLLRQKLWAVMCAAFYFDYANGHGKLAARTLHTVGQIVDAQLMPHTQKVDGHSTYEPFGTRTQLYLMLAQVYRTSRDYPRAQKYFLDAQRQAELRLERELNDADRLPLKARSRKRISAVQFATICTARVLGGLGRLAMAEGRLTRALQLLQSAHTLLLPSGQVALKRVIASHIAITRCRLMEAGTSEWKDAIGDLQRMHDTVFSDKRTGHDGARKSRAREGSQSGDLDGRRRTAQELARAFLEQAEAIETDLTTPARSSERSRALNQADAWIGTLRTLGDERGVRGGDPERYRAHLLAAQRHILMSPPDLSSAERELAAAHAIVDRPEREFCTLDLAGFDHATPDRVDCMLRIAEALASRDERNTSEHGARALRELTRLRQEANRDHDRVLESEAILRLALAQNSFGSTGDAERWLTMWEHYAPFIENASLHALYRSALSKMEPPFKLSTNVSLADAKKEFEAYVCYRALLRHHTISKACEVLKTGPDTFRDAVERYRHQRD